MGYKRTVPYDEAHHSTSRGMLITEKLKIASTSTSIRNSILARLSHCLTGCFLRPLAVHDRGIAQPHLRYQLVDYRGNCRLRSVLLEQHDLTNAALDPAFSFWSSPSVRLFSLALKASLCRIYKYIPVLFGAHVLIKP